MRKVAQRVWRGKPVGLLALAACLVLAAPASAEFEFLGDFGEPGPEQILIPIDIESDGAAGGFYVVEPFTRRVKHFDASGGLVASWKVRNSAGEFMFPVAIGIAPAGDVYVGAVTALFTSPGTGTLPATAVQRYDSAGNLITEWGELGGAEGQFGGIVSGISVDGAGDVYVVDQAHDRIQKFGPNGDFLLMWGKDVNDGGVGEVCVAGCKAGEPGGAEREFDSPEDVVAGAGSIYVTDSDNHRLQQFSSVGNFQRMGGRGVDGGGNYETCVGLCQPGFSGGSMPGEFDNPQGIGLDPNGGGTINVTDGANDHIHILSPSLVPSMTTIGSSGTGEGEFTNVNGLDSANDKVLTAEFAPGRVQRFAKDGTFEAAFGGLEAGSLLLPAAIEAGSAQVLVSAGLGGTLGSAAGAISRFDPSGSFLGTWGTIGSGQNEIQAPDGIALDGAGGAHVVDAGADEIKHFDAGGNLVGSFGTGGSDPGQLDSPNDVARSPADGTLFTSEGGTDRIQKFSPIGAFLGTWGAAGDQPGQLDDPQQLALGPDGSIYVADNDNHRIQRFDADGNLLSGWGEEGSGDGQMMQPSGVGVDELGNVYVADSGNHRVQRFDESGTFLGKWGAGGGDGTSGDGDGEFFFPNGIAIDPAGDIYVLDQGNSRVQKFAGATPPPELVLGLPKRVKLKKLRKRRVSAKVGCGETPCSVILGGKVQVKVPKGKQASAGAKKKFKKVNLKLVKRRFDLAEGEERKQRLKLRRHKKKVRKLGRLLRRQGKVRAKLIVSVGATNEAGADKAKAKAKVKRPKKKGKKKTKKG